MTTTIILALVAILVAAIGWKIRQAQGGSAAAPSLDRQAVATEPAGRDVPVTEEGIRMLLGRGEKIEAIKLMRALRGLGLREAKEAVDRLEAGHSLSAAPETTNQLRPEQAAAHPEFRRLIAEDRRIEAVKFYRDATGCGLKEAKEAMDRAVEELGA